MNKSPLLCILLVFGFGLTTQAGRTNKANLTWTDPKKAAAEDPDFTVQGEYGVAKKEQAWAVQIVALGDGTFDAYLLESGLPGLGWDRRRARIKLSGVREGDVVSLASPDGAVKAVIEKGRITVRRGGRQIADLPRLVRKSPTLGAKPPQGAVVLFDGTSAEAWIRAWSRVRMAWYS